MKGKEIADASPQKEFFINMITKDISLSDCILDLLDNCVDGANAEIVSSKKPSKRILHGHRYRGYYASITFDSKSFEIEDNCGGISVGIAMKYAFHFGRSNNTPLLKGRAIGLYGIGMKRAIFKIGRIIHIESSTAVESFKTKIDVAAWAQKREQEGKWSFDLLTDNAKNKGTTIKIPTLTKEASIELGDPEFERDLRKIIMRDYALILAKGFKIKVNGEVITPLQMKILNGKQYGAARFKRTLKIKKDKNKKGKSVKFEVIAGLWKADDPDDPDLNMEEIEPGWYVVCNDRVVLPADKSYRTGWGTNIRRKWHSQYKPFIGFAMFNSSDPTLLPWNTTKRGVDLTSDVYRQALVLMADVTDPAIDYTNKKKVNPEPADKLETKAHLMSIFDVPSSAAMRLPVLIAEPPIKMATIRYRIKEDKLIDVKEALSEPSKKNSEVGELTFNYFYDREVK
jgi:hypothetical protein